MDWKIELIAVPVTDIDRAKDFYLRIGFVLDMDQAVSDDIRFVQLTPPGSACSISLGRGLTAMEPGSLDNIQVVVADAEAALAHLISLGVDARGVNEFAWGRFVTFSDPDGNEWALQQLPDYSTNPYAEFA